MSETLLRISDWMSGLGSSLLIFLLVAIVCLLVGLIYIVYTEKKHNAWLTQRKDSIKASFNDGVLKVTVPKKEEIFNKKKIEIE